MKGEQQFSQTLQLQNPELLCAGTDELPGSSSVQYLSRLDTFIFTDLVRELSPQGTTRHHSIGSQSSRQSSSPQLLETATEDQAAGRGLSPRDSGFDGAASSLKFDSRPSSGTAKLDTDEVKHSLFISSVLKSALSLRFCLCSRL